MTGCVKAPFVDGGHRPLVNKSSTASVEKFSRSDWVLSVLYLLVYLQTIPTGRESTLLKNIQTTENSSNISVIFPIALDSVP